MHGRGRRRGGECRFVHEPEAFDPLKLDLQVVMNYPVWVLGTALRFPARAGHALITQ